MRLHFIIYILIVGMVLTACAGRDRIPAADETLPPALRATPFATALAAPGGSVVTTAGYYYNDGAGAVLVDGLSFSGERPLPLDGMSSGKIWLGDGSSADIQNGLQTSGVVQYAPLLATGRLEGPGAYGPEGRFPFQLASPRLSLLVPIAVTVTALLENMARYEGQFVRVKGALIVNADSALLADQVEPGGVPTAASRQLKLAEAVRDTQLLARLNTSARGVARYGEVEIEGFWRKGALIPLGIVPL